MATEIVLTPNYSNIFRQMIQEARNQGEASSIFRDVRPKAAQVEALRAVQRFLAPLAIAAACMTSTAEVEQLRDALCTINTGIDTRANEMENQ